MQPLCYHRNSRLHSFTRLKISHAKQACAPILSLCMVCSCAFSFNFVMQKKKSFPSNAWLCSCSRKITRNDYQTLSSLYINETMKQCWSLSSQCVIVSQINYLPQPLASQISVPSDQIYWCFAYSPLTSDKIHQSLCSKTPTNVDTPSCVVFLA